ncbi:MAG: tRNA lysidine(34) synthetase TilS [Deltaproteobacteria bacterium]|nr:tRNA lysidine(34) synthetase TilS [Deltaproteobacteria bacterium]
MHPLEHRLLEHLRHPEPGGEALVKPGEAGLLMVSGGSDSLALLYLLQALRGLLRLRLEVLTCDHGLRAESAREVAWVAERTALLGLPCHIRRTETLLRLESGIPAAARAWRRAEAQTLREARGLDWVATGHQREDHLETWWLKFLRGAHLSHLRGMTPREGVFRRPLLGMGREELQGYLRDTGREWLEDPSNTSPAYRRNRVRHELIPLMDELASGALASRVHRLERQSRALEVWLEQTAPWPPPQEPGNPAGLSVRALEGLPYLARAARLHRFLGDAQSRGVDWEMLEALLALLETGGEQWEHSLPGGGRVRRRGERLVLGNDPGEGDEVSWPCMALSAGRRVRHPPHWRVQETGLQDTGSRRVGEAATLQAKWALHGVPEGAELLLRARRRGDRFHPPEWAHERPLADFLRARRVAAPARDQLPVLAWEGRILAVAPEYVSEEVHRGRHPLAAPFVLEVHAG